MEYYQIFTSGIKTLMFEEHIDNLGGWAGDLQTLMVDTYKETNGNDDYYVFYNELYNNIGVDSLSFKMDDLYADIDAYNIYVFLYEEYADSLKDAFTDYYFYGYKKRYSRFANGLDVDEIKEVVSTYTQNKYMSFVHWPLFEQNGKTYNFTESQSEAARDAFADFLMERVNNE